MKKCQSCNYENADEMRFCVECGMLLAASPMVINLQPSETQKQSNVETASFGKSLETQIGGKQPNFTPNIPTAAPPRRRNNGKIFLAVGGVFALFFLLLTAGAAIVYFNWKPTPMPLPTPKPVPTRTIEKPTPSPTPTATSTPTPSPSPKSDSAPSSSFEKMWVDYNVTEKGQFGMRIHVDFTTYNLKGIEADVVIRFQKEDDSYLLTNTGAFKTKNGEVAVSRALKPGFDTAVYKDLQFFMPYNEFKLSRGKYNLKMDADLNYQNGDLIQHLNFYEFEYEEK